MKNTNTVTNTTNNDSRTYAETMDVMSDSEVLTREKKAGILEFFEKYPFVKTFLMIFMAVLDFQVFYPVLDRALVQNAFMSYFLSFSFAFTLNFLPLLIVIFYYKWKHRLDKNAGTTLIIALSGFVAMVIAMFVVRMEFSDAFEVGTGSGLINGATGQAAGDSKTYSGIPIVLLFTVSPIVTSIICGLLTYWTYDPLKEQLYTAKQRRRELIMEIHRLEYAKHHIERDPEELKKADNEKYLKIRDQIHEQCMLCRTEAMLRLEEFLGRADAVSVISENSIAAVSEDKNGSNGEEVRFLQKEVKGA